jgi:hypothetical protein
MEECEALIGNCPVKDRSAFLVVQFNRQVIDPVKWRTEARGIFR